MSGVHEAEAFAQLPLPPEREVERVAHLVLMALLPALAESDLERFGSALTEIQAITGGWFASVQGGTFAPGATAATGAADGRVGRGGVGQSSWGPAVYGIVENEAAGQRLFDKVRASLGSAGRVYQGPFPAMGARVWRAPISALPAPA